MQIELLDTGDILTLQDWNERHPCVSFPQPLTDEILLDFNAKIHVPVPDREKLQLKAKEDINKWRDEQESAAFIFEYEGAMWDGGLVVRQRLQPVISLNNLPSGFFWTDHDNQDVVMSLEELKDFNLAHEYALVDKGFSIHAKQRQMKSAIEDMSLEELQAFIPSWNA